MADSSTTASPSGGGLDLGYSLTGADIAVISVYFLTLVAIGFADVILRCGRRACGRNGTPGAEASSAGYFLASREMGPIAVAASLFASNIGSEHFIGLAGSGAEGGIAVGGFEWSAGFFLMLLGWAFVPAYLAAAVFTMPEYMSKRFGGRRLRAYLTIVSLLLYVFTKVSVTLYAGGVIFQAILGWNVYVSAITLIAATGLYTAVGGLRAVVYTEVFQTVALVLGGCALMIVVFAKVDGLQGLKRDYGLPDSYFHLFRPATDADFPWTGMVFGIPPGSLWYWCTDQVIVQRVLCAKSQEDARLGAIGASLLKVLPMFMMVLPGVAARALFPEEIATHGGDVAYPLLVVRLLPSGVVGFMVAAMLAALMSSLASVFNSSSTLFAMDVWRMVRPAASDRQVVVVGRITVVVMCAIGVAWIPVISGTNDQLFLYIQRTSAYLAPPISVAFCFSFWRRATESATFASLLCGLIIGLARLLLDITGPDTGVWFATINYLHFALFLSLCCGVVLVSVTFVQTRGKQGYLTLSASYTIEETRPGTKSGAEETEFGDGHSSAWDSTVEAGSDREDHSPTGLLTTEESATDRTREVGSRIQPKSGSTSTRSVADEVLPTDSVRLLPDPGEEAGAGEVAEAGCPPVLGICRASPLHATLTLGVVLMMVALYAIFA